MSYTPCSKQTARRGAMKTLTLIVGMSMTLSAVHQAWAANITSCPTMISQLGHYHVRTDLTCPAGTPPAPAISKALQLSEFPSTSEVEFRQASASPKTRLLSCLTMYLPL